MLRAEELFGIALRIIGAVLVYYGLQSLLDALLFNMGYFNYPDSSPNYYLISGLFTTILGIYLVRGAAVIVAFAYPSADVAENDEQSNDVNENSDSR